MGDELTAADVHAACIVTRVTLAEMFEPCGATEALEPWRARVMAFDGVARVE